MLVNISSMMYVVNMAHYTHNLENNLKRVRTTVGLTQSKLAANVGISRQAYSSLEAGRANPSTEVALRLARELQKTVDSLFFLTEQPQLGIEAELAVGSKFDTLAAAAGFAARRRWEPARSVGPPLRDARGPHTRPPA